MIDDQPIIRIDYDRPYDAAGLYIELGLAERHESVVGAIYRNVIITRR